MKIAKTVLIASAFALAAGSAWAADKDKSSSSSSDKSVGSTVGNTTRSDDSGFAKLDKNKDGYISKLEAKGEPELSKNFDKWDLNNDGKLNRAEYLAAMAKEDAVKAKDKVSSKVQGGTSSSGSTAPSSKQ
jgi:Ca2+-binding EF-hand superfamily protein